MTAPLLQLGPGGDFAVDVRGRGRRLVAGWAKRPADQDKSNARQQQKQQTHQERPGNKPAVTQARKQLPAADTFFRSTTVPGVTYDAWGRLPTPRPVAPRGAVGHMMASSSVSAEPSASLRVQLLTTSAAWLAEQQRILASLDHTDAAAADAAPTFQIHLAAA